MSETTFFAPQLMIPHGTININFYVEAFGAKILRDWKNDDGSIHVAELEISGCLFHVHETMERLNCLSPGESGHTTAIIGIFVPDVDEFVQRAKTHGAIVLHEPKTYEYNYRQAELRDSFGHIWLVEKKM